MKLKLNTPIINFDGSNAKDENQKDISIKDLLVSSLRFGGQDEKEEEKKYKRFKILFELQSLKSNEIEFTAEQVVDIKALGNQIMPDPWIYGQFCNILEGK